ncbi:hypothetical protein O6H91_04G026800 [Diphasiastrum complanatum]|uniref:Uncharacterized protein n=1 Tax=Diphasiastrum complanatum TaxID=34168 RepID=A0ACC2DVD2_DIPCM|nr:hypothetical protein O6H91_04G026800 [Diphasiastrum complanatum]
MLMYGFQPRSPINVETKSVKIQKVADFLHDMQEMLQVAKDSICSAQDRAKHYTDLKRSPRDFKVDDWVYLRIPKDSKALRTRKHYKLSTRYCGPFRIVCRIGSLAYELDLQGKSTAHPVFHVSRWKLSLHDGDTVGSDEDLSHLEDLSLSVPLEPEKVLRTRDKQLRNRSISECLIRWKGRTEDDDSWERVDNIKKNFPNFSF